MIKRVNMLLNYNTSAKRTAEWFDEVEAESLSNLDKWLTAGYEIISKHEYDTSIGYSVCFVLYKRRAAPKGSKQ